MQPLPPDCHDVPRFQRAWESFDAANAEDPTPRRATGHGRPYEVFYAEQVTKWVWKLDPQAPEALLLAARSQHLRRWQIPRDSYPMDRAGYLRWRAELKEFHAAESARLLSEAGYDAGTIERVRRLNLKSDLGRDDAMQTLEDALCLVTLEHQLADLMQKHDGEKLAGVLRRTWNKMSPAGRAAARTISYPEAGLALLKRALAPD